MVPLRLVSMMRSISSISQPPALVTPALLTSTSIAGVSAATVSNAALTAARSPTSQGSARILPLDCSASVSSFSRPRAMAHTVLPSPANRSAHARPTPVLVPVITYTAIEQLLCCLVLAAADIRHSTRVCGAPTARRVPSRQKTTRSPPSCRCTSCCVFCSQ